MSNFQWVTVVFGMLIGLTVTRLLTSLACALRSRHISRLYWVSLAWVAVIFLDAMDAWWSLRQLKNYQDWSFTSFLMMMMQPLLLVFAAVMILPFSELKPGDDHRDIYNRDGRWALIAIALFHLEGLCEAIFFWDAKLNPWGYLGFSAYILLVVAGFFAGRRTSGIVATAALATNVFFVFTQVADLWQD